MIFASKTPRDLNHDPLPWLSRTTGVLRYAQEPEDGWGYDFAPRPEFDHKQHNEPNPILVAVRADYSAEGESAICDWAYAIEEFLERPDAPFDPDGELRLSVYHELTQHLPSASQIDHARRILARLAALATKTTPQKES